MLWRPPGTHDSQIRSIPLFEFRTLLPGEYSIGTALRRSDISILTVSEGMVEVESANGASLQVTGIPTPQTDRSPLAILVSLAPYVYSAVA
jgi:hypothetical protein